MLSSWKFTLCWDACWQTLRELYHSKVLLYTLGITSVSPLGHLIWDLKYRAPGESPSTDSVPLVLFMKLPTESHMPCCAIGLLFYYFLFWARWRPVQAVRSAAFFLCTWNWRWCLVHLFQTHFTATDCVCFPSCKKLSQPKRARRQCRQGFCPPSQLWPPFSRPL